MIKWLMKVLFIGLLAIPSIDVTNIEACDTSGECSYNVAQKVYFYVVDTDGITPETGVSYTAVTIGFTKDDNTTSTIALAADDCATLTDGDWCEIDATNQPGLYYVYEGTTATFNDIGNFTTVYSATGHKTQPYGYVINAEDRLATTDFDSTATVATATVDELETQSQAAPVGFQFNTKMINDDSTAAVNLELQYDGTGLTGDTFPATQQQLSNIALTGAAVATPAKDAPNGFTITFGENEANDEDSTHALDDVTHDLEAFNDGGTEKIEAYYEFAIGGDGIPEGVTAHQYMDKGGGSSKNLTVWAYNWGGTTWDQVGTLNSGTSLETDIYTLFTSHVGTGANIGLVRFRYLTGSVSLSATSKLLVDQIFVTYAINSRTVGYAGGQIWVDTVGGTAGIELHVNGVADNASLLWADALTIGAALNIKDFHIANGSGITLTANSDNYSIIGHGYTLALGGQSITNAYIFGGDVTGVGTGGGTVFEDTPIGNVTLAPSIIRRGYLYGTITNSATGDWFINHSVSRKAGGAPVVFDYGTAIGSTNLNARDFQGRFQLESMGNTGTDAAEIEGTGEVIEGTSTGGIVTVSGNMAVSGFTNLTLSDDARIDVAQINSEADLAISDYAPNTVVPDAAGVVPTAVENRQEMDSNSTELAKISELTTQGDTNETHLTDLKGATFSGATDSNEAIRDRGDAAWVTGAGGDPWVTALPGAYGAGTAGKIIGDNINAPLDTIDTVVDGVKAVTDNLPNSGSLTDLAAILLDTAEIGTAGVGLSNLGGISVAMQLQIQENIIQTIESQRGTHSGFGNHFYWDPSGGNDSNDCLTIATACLTFAYIQTNKVVANNHDIVHAYPGASTAQTVSNEEITISKAYTFLRGPGRDFKILADTTSTDTVTISAEGVELSGMIVNTAATGAMSAIVVTGDFALIHHVWVDQTMKYGIELNTSSNSRVYDVVLQDAGGGGSDAAIYIKGTTGGDAQRNILWNLTIISPDVDGIRINDDDDTGAIHNTIIGNGKGVIITDATGWGVNEVNGDENHIIGPNVMLHGNASGPYNITGPGSQAINVDNWSTETALAVVDGNVDSVLSDTGADGVVVAAGSKTGYALSAAGIDAILDDTVDGTRTLREVLCAMAATQFGKNSGMGTTTVTFRNIDDDANVVVGTMDSSYNRTAVTLTLTGCN